MILNAKTSVTIGAFTQVSGDVASTGLSGSVLFDVSSSQGFNFPPFNVLASTVTVNTSAQVGVVFSNDITNNGFVSQELLGFDPATLPQIPAVTPSTPGKTNVSTDENQAKQLCPGAYGTISLGVNSVLNLNGGVYQVNRLTLGDGARLEPSEPVVILVSGAITTGIGSIIRPSAQALNPMTGADIRIEAGGAATLGDTNQIRAHLLVAGKLTTGKGLQLIGAAWARAISIGPSSSIAGESSFAASTPTVPPPCNDNNTCTTDTCVGGGTSTAFCRNAPVTAGTSCEDGNVCNGAEACDASGACQPGQNVASGTSCSDNNTCNGAETCDGLGSCDRGTPLVVDDDNPCTADACDATAGVSHTALPDGTKCNGFGVCQAGVCSVTGALFSEDFVQFASPTPAQCASWNDFLDNQLSNRSFQSITVSGTFEPTGVTCNDPSAATQICQALHAHSNAFVFCNGHSWSVGECGGTELSVDISVCNCSFAETLRPCIGNEFWGGVNTETCDAPSQTMSVLCQ